MATGLKQESSKTIVGQELLRMQIEREALLGALTTTAGAISSKATLPILTNILIQAQAPDKVIFVGTDLELGIKTSCEAQVSVEGAVTAPARKLYEIVKELPDGPIEVTVAKNNAINIKTSTVFFKIMGLGSEDFPKLPEPASDKAFEFEQGDLKRCLTLTSFAISRDEARYTLNGVLLIVRNKNARFVATDGKRLASVEVKGVAGGNIDLEIIIPSKTVAEIVKATSEGSGKAQILAAQNQILFQLGPTTIVSRLIEGRFPNFEQVIPKDEKTTARLKRADLFAALKRVSILTSQENQAVKLDFMKGKILISSRSPNLGEAKEDLTAEVSGGDLTIGFNPDYIVEALKNLDDDEVVLAMTEPDKPGLIKAGDGYLYVVMPMQLS